MELKTNSGEFNYYWRMSPDYKNGEHPNKKSNNKCVPPGTRRYYEYWLINRETEETMANKQEEGVSSLKVSLGQARMLIALQEFIKILVSVLFC